MLGIGWRLLLLALGGLAGYGLAYGVTLDDLKSLMPRDEPAAAAYVEAQVPAAVPEDDCPPPAVRTPGLPADGAATPSRPVGAETDILAWNSARDPQTPEEWYRAFAAETRDDARAGPAEERIAELLAESGTPGLRTEYLRCATRFCTIAGYVDDANAFDSCAIGGWIGGAAVFRGNLRYSCIDREEEGRRRFIVFIDSAPKS